MHAEDIKAAIRKKWGTLSALSRHLGKHKNIVAQTISTPGYSVPTERYIARELNRLPHDVWPDRFHYDGSPISVRAERIVSADGTADLRRNGVAA